ncbi:hypothetical protein [Actinoplanes auranticolor]|uniref:Uncharacterized protein n=1 Tax=Actinoplanes auranticolor TaxID=47988 RepID=A0A919VV71_9ACTN|nr:hypothetical protein [Actinoplanes auranticolor]GIM76405.1 hypothetical protein Aau02nite_70700 [Actinoplanes auranticolor]
MGNTVTLDCHGQDYGNHEVTVQSGAKGRPDFSSVWRRKFISCDLVLVDNSQVHIRPITAVEKAVDRLAGRDGDIGFFYEECAAVDPDDVFTQPGFKIGKENFANTTATLTLCPNHPYAAEWKSALRRGRQEDSLERAGRIFGSGTYRVGKDIKPGTYVARDVDGCYWERQTRNGDVIDNAFVMAASRVQVTIRSTDYGFHTQGCGTWRHA